MTGRTKIRRIRDLLLCVLATVVFLGTALPVPEAFAQQRRRSVLEMLFGPPVQSGRPQQRRQQAAPQRRQQRAEPRRQRAEPRREVRRERAQKRRAEPAKRSAGRRRAPAAPAAAAAAPAVAAVVKSEDARTILVVGDFLAASLADGLVNTVAENRDVKVVGRTDGSSGLVRADHYDWIGQLPGIIDETKPAVVAVMIGANDRQPIRASSFSYDVRSPEWTAEYENRIEAVAGIVRDRGLPLVWVGLPAFQSDNMTADMVFLNDLYRKAAISVGGEFVDVWGGFVDANGAFTSSGPDTEGQPARLRNSDGITMAPAGQEKLAYFAEKTISKIMGFSVDAVVASLAPRQLSETQLPALSNAANAPTAAPVAFTDPALDGGEALLGGGAPAVASLEPSPRDRLVKSGAQLAAQEGRADDFNWTGKSTAVSPVTQSNAIVFRGSTSIDALRAKPATPPAPAEGAPAAMAAGAAPGSTATDDQIKALIEAAPAIDPSVAN